jgi:hypothetical protein
MHLPSIPVDRSTRPLRAGVLTVTPSPARRSSRRTFAPFRPINAELIALSPISISASNARLLLAAAAAAAAVRGVQTGRLSSVLASRTARCSASLYASIATRALQRERNGGACAAAAA